MVQLIRSSLQSDLGLPVVIKFCPFKRRQRQAMTREPRASPNYDPNRSLNAGLRGGVYQKSPLLFWIWREYRTSEFTQLPKRSGSNSGLRDGWYQLSASECVICLLFGTGLINLASNSVPVEEQPVARATVAPSASGSSNAARSMCFAKTPKGCPGSKVPPLGGHIVFTRYCLIVIR